MDITLEFRCGVENGTKGGYCYANSQCAIDRDSGEEICVNCDPGYEHDFTWGHFANCNLPTGFLTYFFAASFTMSMSAVLIMFSMRRSIHKNLRQLVLLFAVLLIVECIENMTLYIENGRFAVANLLVVLRLGIVSEANLHLNLLLTKSLSPVLRQTRFNIIERRYQLITYLPALAFGVLGIIQAVYSRSRHSIVNGWVPDENLKHFNTPLTWPNRLVLIAFFFAGIHFALLTGTCIYLITQILNKVRNYEEAIAPEIARKARRLRIMRLILVCGMCATSIACVYAVTMLLAVNSIPYAWALTIVLSGFSMASPAFITFIRRYSATETTANCHKLTYMRSPRANFSSYTPWKSRSRLLSTVVLNLPPSIPVWFADAEEKPPSSCFDVTVRVDSDTDVTICNTRTEQKPTTKSNAHVSDGI